MEFKLYNIALTQTLQDAKTFSELSKERIKEMSDMFDGIAFEQLIGAAPSIDIAIKRYRLRKEMTKIND